MSKTLNEAVVTAEDVLGSAVGGAEREASGARPPLFIEATSSEALRRAIMRTLDELRREAAEKHGKGVDDDDDLDEDLGDVVESVRGDKGPKLALHGREHSLG
jgi:hypothetical protein